MPSTSRRPGEHVFDNRISDLAFGFEHFKDLIAEEVFQIMGFHTWCDMKYPIIGKATICDNGVQMGIEILKRTESLDGDGSAGGGITIRNSVFQVHQPRRAPTR
jgi:hypothetical protein